MWLKKFVDSLTVVDNISKPLQLYCDNKPPICYSYNKPNVAAKHIGIKYYIVTYQTIELEHIKIEKMLTDLFTRGLRLNMFRKHKTSIGLMEHP